MTEGQTTSEYFNNKLASIVSLLGVLAAWIATFADALSEQGALVITATAGLLAALTNGGYALSRGLAKGATVVVEETETEG